LEKELLRADLDRETGGTRCSAQLRSKETRVPEGVSLALALALAFALAFALALALPFALSLSVSGVSVATAVL
jgi:hypothetical protein